MKYLSPIYIALSILLFTSCGDDQEQTSTLFQDNRTELIQTYEFDLGNELSNLVFTTNAGCTFRIGNSKFSLDGEGVSGIVKIDIVEIFDKGTMAITGKHTMAGEQILISGGEFFIRAYQGDKDLDYEGSYRVSIPGSLTGTYSTDMQMFRGGEGIDSNQDWVVAPNVVENFGVFFWDSSVYNIFVDDFEWFNCDRFLDNPGELIDLNISVPSGFNESNTLVYLAIKGEPSSLGIATSGLYPKGMDIHLILVSAQEDEFLYEIISGPVSEDKYKFDKDNMKTATPEQLKDIINGLE